MKGGTAIVLMGMLTGKFSRLAGEDFVGLEGIFSLFVGGVRVKTAAAVFDRPDERVARQPLLLNSR